jgi:iron complex outermembrane receptor protein
MILRYFLPVLGLLVLISVPALGQSSGTVRGTITLGDNGQPVHGVLVTILQLRRDSYTDKDGKYEFQGVPVGKYDLVAKLRGVPDTVQSIEVKSGDTAVLDLKLALTGVREQVTVTSTGEEQVASSSIQSVAVVDSLELAKKNPVSLGETLDSELGVSKRSFGPGTARPVIRGFDGDRVLVLEDGERIGGLGFQSGDHAEPLNVLSIDRIEIVKGPATLLYGSNAIGGVVNAISGHDAARPGFTGYLTGLGGTNRGQWGSNAGLQFGTQKWLFWANGGAQGASDYETPLHRVPNSFTRAQSFSGGVGHYGDKFFLSSNYTFDNRHYGIPYDPDEADPEVVFLNPRRHSVQFKGGFHDVDSFVTAGNFSVQYNDYTHSEIDSFTNEVGTSFGNKTFLYQGVFDQKKKGRLAGRIGFWGLHRDFESIGDEALAPPTKQIGFALFALETLELEKVTLQFGGRLETNRYSPEPTVSRGLLPDRSFTGFSGAVGIRVPAWQGGAFVANYSHSYRAPALEELFNEGPHPGNLAFEIGDPGLRRELGDGLDLGLRHSSKRFRFEANGYFYHIRDFVFLAPTGAEDPGSGLIIAEYKQATTRHIGTEAKLDVALHPRLWLNLGADYVNAELTSTITPLPRIPPLRARAGLEFTYKGLTLNPEVVMAQDQNRLFPTETRTAGYTVFNLSGSYLIAQQHYAHIISFSTFNLGDRLYRNHLSFIKEFAPEVGRGLRATYTLRFF